MLIDPADFPNCPHQVTWQPKKDGNRGGPANDGKEDSATSPAVLNLFLDPKPSIWAERTYGIVTERETYLVIGKVADMEKLVVGDELTFGDKVLTIKAKPQIFPPFNGFEHGETVAVVEKTGGRS